MKKLAQASSVFGALVSLMYIVIWASDFASITAFLSFIGVFASTFFFSEKENSKQQQSIGDNSTGYQAGRDIKIHKD
ncbi:MAG TPA: hypothetical protein VFX02_09305 [Gammaproteobacteria bacterium]|nr:hypothetical protein [Gammaproteobacteria bacterium]